MPVLALGALLIALVAGMKPWLVFLCGAALAGAVFVAVHHAEVVAHRVGEPFGTLVLVLAVTAIETALILSMMVAGGHEMALLTVTFLVSAITLGTGRTYMMQGAVHLVLFVGYLFLAFVP